jgi:hypothetical protein
MLAFIMTEKISANCHWLRFGMIDVGWNNRPPARHFFADEFRCHEFRQRRAERFAPRVDDKANLFRAVHHSPCFKRDLATRDFRGWRRIPFPA